MKVSTILASLAVAAASASAAPAPTTNTTVLHAGTPGEWVDINDMDYAAQFIVDDADEADSGNIGKRAGGASQEGVPRGTPLRPRTHKMGTGELKWWRPDGYHYHKGPITHLEWFRIDDAPVCKELVDGHPCYFAQVKWYPRAAGGKKSYTEGLLANYYPFRLKKKPAGKRDEENVAGNSTVAEELTAPVSEASPVLSPSKGDALCAFLVAVGVLVWLL